MSEQIDSIHADVAVVGAGPAGMAAALAAAPTGMAITIVDDNIHPGGQIWRDGPGGIDVAFGDGRPFHRVGPGAQAVAAHDCPPDDYRLRYDFGAWPLWSVRWRVTGPRKDYRALTYHVRG